MFKLADGRKYLYQWDLDIRLLAINEEPLDEIHFSVSNGEVYRSEIQSVDDIIFAEIPNILLQQKRPIFAMPYCHTDNGIYTKGKYKLEIIPRPKPDDYVCTDVEIKRYEKLEELIVHKITNPTTAEVGQILEVEEVDENGVPTKWKTTNKTTATDEQIAGAVKDYLDKNSISIKVDSELSEESENPVQNKVIAKKISQIETNVGNVDALLSTI